MQKFEKILTKPWFGCVLLTLLTFSVWGKSLAFDFVWDDFVLVLRNKYILTLSSIPATFFSLDPHSSQNIDVPPAQKIASYRPLRTMQYTILQAIDGKKEPQPWIFHLGNLLWQTAAVLLLFSVAKLLFEGAGAYPSFFAFLVAAAFAVHPVISEVVCWIKSLDDIMATVFVLAATRSLLLWNGKGRGMIAPLIYFGAAMYSKENAVPFVAVAAVLLLYRYRLPWSAIFKWTAAFTAVALIYLVHRHLIIGRSSQGEPLSGTRWQTIIDTIPAISTYFRLMWGIPPFCIDYTYMPSQWPIFSLPVLAGLGFLLCWCLLTVWCWRVERFRPAAFGLLWLGLFLLPVANIIPMVQYMAERFLYLPLIGVLLALGFILLQFPARFKMPLIFVGLIALWIPLSMSRAEIWRDEVTLFFRTSVENPPIERIRENAVVALFKLPHIAAMFSLTPETHKIGVGNLPAGQGDAIIQSLAEAHRLMPDEQRITSALGITYAVTGHLSNSIPLLQLATQQNASDSQCWVDLASAYGVAKNWPDAHVAYETALRLNPTNIFALRRYTQMCWNLDEHQKALPYLRTLQQIEPTNTQVADRIRDAEAHQ